MDSFFPPPLPDESLYSLVARNRISVPYSNSHVSRSSFGYQDALNPPSFLGQNSFNFYRRHSEFWRNERGFIREMTGYNLLAPFLTASVQGRLYKSLKGYVGNVIPMLRSHLFFSNVDFSCLKYCPRCIIEDIELHGVAYWHRSHCIWIASQCWKHQCKLVQLKSRGNKFELPPQEELSFESCEESRLNSNNVSYESLIQELLAGRLPFGINITHLCKVYSDALRQRGDVDSDSIQDKISSYYGENTLKGMGVRLTFNGKGRRRWVCDVLNGRAPVSIQEHLLVIKEQFGGISGLGRVLHRAGLV